MQHLQFVSNGIQQNSDVTLSLLFAQTEHRMRTAHKNHLGYPYNLTFTPQVPAKLSQYLINNLGDPFTGSHYASDVCEIERQCIDWFMDLWDCDDHEAFWGSIGASGTEGNLWGIYLGREALPDAVLIHSNEAHYSIPKAARILRMKAECVKCEDNGEINLVAFAETLTRLRSKKLVIALTCGTTMKGAHDNIAEIIRLLDEAGITADHRYIHVDGALNAMVIPFIYSAPIEIKPSFHLAIDSISTSGHKMIGTPMPCGVLVARKHHVDRVASAVAYLRSNDTTLMGSRNGHAVLAIFAKLFGHGTAGYRRDVSKCLKMACRVTSELKRSGVPAQCNPHSLTIVFPQPEETIVKLYQLACYQGNAHAIIMPNVTDDLVNRFKVQYLAWWRMKTGGGIHS